MAERGFLTTVKWFSNEKGYGFLVDPRNSERDIMVHHLVIEMDGFRTLTAGQEVRCESEVPQGKGPRATWCKPVSKKRSGAASG